MSNSYLDVLKKWGSDSRSESFAFPLLFLKIGTYRVRILDDEPVCKEEHYGSTGEKRYTICPGKGCLFCERGDAKKYRFYTNVIDRADGKRKVMVYSLATVNGDKDSGKNGLSAVFELAGAPKLYDIEIISSRVKKENKDGSIGEYMSYSARKVGENSEPEAGKLFDIRELIKPMLPSEQIKHIYGNAGGRKSDGGNAASGVAAALNGSDTPL